MQGYFISTGAKPGYEKVLKRQALINVPFVKPKG